MHWIFFGVACRVCDGYDRKEKANKRLLESNGGVLES